MKLQVSDYLKNLIINGKAHKHLKKGWMTYDEVVVSRSRVEFKHLGNVIGYMDIRSGDFDSIRGDTLTIQVGEMKNRMRIE